MKRPRFHWIALSICLCWGSSVGISSDKRQPRTLTDQENRVAQSVNDFTFRLLSRVNQNEDGRNVFVSPFSVSMALGMTLNGADGLTESAMLATLGQKGMASQEISQANAGIMSLLCGLDSTVKMTIANSIWYRRGLRVEQEFINVNQRYYDASVRDLVFESPEAPGLINTWVDSSTHGKIRQIVDGGIPPDVVMYLMNAIYFKGMWKYKFEKRATLDAPFYLADGTTKPTRLMTKWVELPYSETAAYQAISLPYGDSLFSMIIVLPSKGQSVESFVKDMTLDSWNSIVGGLRAERGTIFLPRFKMEFGARLNDVLKEMGMGRAFSSSAEFPKMSRDTGFFISEVRHKTFVQVDEEGTEAAAVTAVIVNEVSAYREPHYFVMRVDRPFFFAIAERQTGALLFVGKVVEPKEP